MEGLTLQMPITHKLSDGQLHKNKSRGSRRRLRLLAMIVLCFTVWAGMIFWKQADQIGDKVSQLLAMEHRLAETQQVNERLKLEITRLNDPEYIEQKARKEYQMIGEGETLFIAPVPEGE